MGDEDLEAAMNQSARTPQGQQQAARGPQAEGHGRRLTQDRSGTIADYDRRVQQAQVSRWTGLGVATAGAIAIGVAIVRWRFSARTELLATTAGGLATVVVGRQW